MRRDLAVVEHGSETLDQVGCRDHLNSPFTHHLHSSRVNHRHVRNPVLRRVLHRHPADAFQQLVEPSIQLLPSSVTPTASGEVFQCPRFDRMNEAPRFPLSWDYVVPPPGLKTVSGKSKNTRR